MAVPLLLDFLIFPDEMRLVEGNHNIRTLDVGLRRRNQVKFLETTPFNDELYSTSANICGADNAFRLQATRKAKTCLRFSFGTFAGRRLCLFVWWRLWRWLWRDAVCFFFFGNIRWRARCWKIPRFYVAFCLERKLWVWETKMDSNATNFRFYASSVRAQTRRPTLRECFLPAPKSFLRMDSLSISKSSGAGKGNQR